MILALLMYIQIPYLVATLSAVVGLVVSYGAALITARSNFINEKKFAIEAIALITNTIPGMVIWYCLYDVSFQELHYKILLL